MRWPAILAAGCLLAPAAAWPAPQCRPPYQLMLAPTFLLDLVAAREACGRQEPAVRAVVERFTDSVIDHAMRIAGPEHGPVMREEYRRFRLARQEINRERAEDMPEACREDVRLTMPEPEVLRLIEDGIAKFDGLTAPGGPLSAPECGER